MKKYIIIIITVLLYLLVMFFVLQQNGSKKNTNKKTTKKEEKNQYIIFNTDTVLKKENNRFLSVKNKKYNEEKYYAFSSSKYLGKYYYRFEGKKQYLYDDNYNPINFNGQLVLNNYNENMKICNLVNQTIDDNDIANANEILKKYNVTYNKTDFVLTKYSCDINNDDINELIYSLKTDYGYEGDSISIVYVNINNKNILVSSTRDTVLLEVLDALGDDNLEILAIELVGSKSCYKVFKYQNNKFKNLTVCS